MACPRAEKFAETKCSSARGRAIRYYSGTGPRKAIAGVTASIPYALQVMNEILKETML